MSSAQGRWTSPDAINLTDERILNPSNTINKYIYAGNNPLKYTDPDGRDILYFGTDEGPAGHSWVVAYNPGGGASEILDFGPAKGASILQRGLFTVPGDTNYAYQGDSHMDSADDIRQHYWSVTIRLNPEDTQRAMNEIKTMKGTLKSYNAIRGPNCTKVCREILNKFTNLNSQAISPSAFWPDVFFKFARPDQLNQPLPRTKGQDYGNPRPGISTYELVWRLLQMNSPAPQEQVTSKICFSGEDGKQVCN
jgi:hypothetical protein